MNFTHDSRIHTDIALEGCFLQQELVHCTCASFNMKPTLMLRVSEHESLYRAVKFCQVGTELRIHTWPVVRAGSSKHVTKVIVPRGHVRLTWHGQVVGVRPCTVSCTRWQRSQGATRKNRVEPSTWDAATTSGWHHERWSVKGVKNHPSTTVKGVQVTSPDVSCWVPWTHKLTLWVGA